MGKKVVFFILLICLIFICTYLYFQLTDSGFFKKAITGEATNANVAVTVSIIAPPSLVLIYPENKTYLINESLKLNFTALSADSIWYNLDNEANNTITGNITFNTSQGAHTIYLFANNSYGNSAKNVTFTVNSTKFTIIYHNYSGSTNGASTDFNESAYEDLQNLSNIILENTNFGKIVFNEAINLTDDYLSSDYVLDLNSNTNISENFIEINTTALPNFNKSATIYIYNLAFTNPRVLRDGAVCPSSICTEVNYSGGIFIFNVTHFSNYSTDETPSEEISPSGGSGRTPPAIFSLSKNKINVFITPGETKNETITITNEGNHKIKLNIENLLEGFLIINEDPFELNRGESKNLIIGVFAREDTIPNLYLGKIVIESERQKKEILVSVEVESQGILLDVRAEINDKYKRILPGDNIFAKIELFNLGGDAGSKDILLEYIIKDYDGREIIKETESLAIETQNIFTKEIGLPLNTKLGSYVFYVRAIYDGKIASSSDNFEVISIDALKKEKIFAGLIIIILLIFGLIIYYKLREKK